MNAGGHKLGREKGAENRERKDKNKDGIVVFSDNTRRVS
jgi:hypothetical protein